MYMISAIQKIKQATVDSLMSIFSSENPTPLKQKVTFKIVAVVTHPAYIENPVYAVITSNKFNLFLETTIIIYRQVPNRQKISIAEMKKAVRLYLVNIISQSLFKNMFRAKTYPIWL